MWANQQEYCLVMKILSITAIASVAFAGNALATDSLRIESEAQFVRDYTGLIEQVGPGVYQIIGGDLAGKVVTIGEAGLNYDLNALRARSAELPKSSSAKTDNDAHIQKLEEQKTRYAQLRMQIASSDEEKFRIYTSISCSYWPYNSPRPTWYSGFVEIYAATEYYLDRGNGTLNPYFARAGAAASGYVNRPFNVPPSVSLFADALVYNAYNAQSVSPSSIGFSSVSVGTGYIYSGPNFSHNLYASSSVQGTGNCFGYVSISDSMRPYW